MRRTTAMRNDEYQDEDAARRQIAETYAEQTEDPSLPVDQAADSLESQLGVTIKGVHLSRNALDVARALVESDVRVYGNDTAKNTAEILAQNYIFKMAKISYPDNPILPKHHAAARLMAIAIGMVTTNLTTEVLAHAAKEIAVLDKTINGKEKD